MLSFKRVAISTPDMRETFQELRRYKKELDAIFNKKESDLRVATLGLSPRLDNPMVHDMDETNRTGFSSPSTSRSVSSLNLSSITVSTPSPQKKPLDDSLALSPFTPGRSLSFWELSAVESPRPLSRSPLQTQHVKRFNSIEALNKFSRTLGQSATVKLDDILTTVNL